MQKGPCQACHSARTCCHGCCYRGLGCSKFMCWESNPQCTRTGLVGAVQVIGFCSGEWASTTTKRLSEAGCISCSSAMLGHNILRRGSHKAFFEPESERPLTPHSLHAAPPTGESTREPPGKARNTAVSHLWCQDCCREVREMGQFVMVLCYGGAEFVLLLK